MTIAGVVFKVSDWVDQVATVMTVILLGAMTIVTTSQIIFRTFFTALIWSDEAARYMMVWLTFIGAGCVHKRSGHIAINMFGDLLPVRCQKYFRIFTQLICLLAFLVVIYFGIEYVRLTHAQLSAAMRIPMRYMYIAMPLGAAIMFIHSIAHIFQIWTDGDSVTDSVTDSIKKEEGQ